MDCLFKKEILAAFPENVVIFDSLSGEMPHWIKLVSKNGEHYRLPKNYCPELAFYDDKNVYCLITINPETIPKEFPYLLYMYPIRSDHAELLATELDSILQKEYGEESKCLINLLFKSYAQFNNFHNSKQNANRPHGRLLQCLLACRLKHQKVVESSLKALELEFKKIETKKYSAYLIDGYSFCWQINSMKRKLEDNPIIKKKNGSNRFTVYVTFPFEEEGKRRVME